MSKVRVALNRCEVYELDRLIQVFREQFRSLEVKIREGMNIVIKPNLILKSKPDEAIITHPAVTAAVAIIMKEMGGNITVAESPGGLYTPSVMRSVYNTCGYTEMAEKYGFSLYTKCESKKVAVVNGEICKSVTVVKPFLEADFVINIAKMKTHSMMGYSGAVKNLFGVVPGLMKPELHSRFPEKGAFSKMLVDICDFIKPNLSIIDAVYAMEGDGPTGGESRFMGTLISSDSPYAADLIALKIMGIDKNEIWTVNEAVARGLSQKSVEELEIIGERPEALAVTNYKRAKSGSIDFLDRLPGFIGKPLRRIATPVPKIREDKCIGCGKCAQSCPEKIIMMKNKKAYISYDKCIRCFCCHEMCPEHIIDIKRFRVFKL